MKYVKNLAIPLLIALLVITADQFTKQWVERDLPLYSSYAPFPNLADVARFTHTTNTGAAFGMFQNGSPIFTVIAFGVIGFLIYYSLKLPKSSLWLALCIGLQLGGASGNLIDRLRVGAVTDFIHVLNFPIFNIADAAITIGVGMLMVLTLFERPAPAQQPAPDQPTEPLTPVTDLPQPE